MSASLSEHDCLFGEAACPVNLAKRPKYPREVRHTGNVLVPPEIKGGSARMLAVVSRDGPLEMLPCAIEVPFDLTGYSAKAMRGAQFRQVGKALGLAHHSRRQLPHRCHFAPIKAAVPQAAKGREALGHIFDSGRHFLCPGERSCSFGSA